MHTFCVVLRQQHSLSAVYPRTKRYFLRAKTAVQAMLITSEDPEWFVIGVEPAELNQSIGERPMRPRIDVGPLIAAGSMRPDRGLVDHA
jgi:hypothetical protein